MREPIKITRPKIYLFDPRTKEFRGESRPDICQASLARDEVLFLYPGFSTEMPPPETPRRFVAVWDGNDWRLRPDHRGETWWQGDRAVHIADLGDPSELGLTAEPPPPEEPVPPDPIVERKHALLASLNEVSALGASYVAIKQPVPKHIVDEHAALAAELHKLMTSR